MQTSWPISSKMLTKMLTIFYNPLKNKGFCRKRWVFESRTGHQRETPAIPKDCGFFFVFQRFPGINRRISKSKSESKNRKLNEENANCFANLAKDASLRFSRNAVFFPRAPPEMCMILPLRRRPFHTVRKKIPKSTQSYRNAVESPQIRSVPP